MEKFRHGYETLLEHERPGYLRKGSEQARGEVHAIRSGDPNLYQSLEYSRSKLILGPIFQFSSWQIAERILFARSNKPCEFLHEDVCEILVWEDQREVEYENSRNHHVRVELVVEMSQLQGLQPG